MKKLLTLMFVLVLSGCASYGHYSDVHPIDNGPRYECWPDRGAVVCYDNFDGRYRTYFRSNRYYSYWHGYMMSYQPRVIVTPRWNRHRRPVRYKENPRYRVRRGDRPRVRQPRPSRPEVRRPPRQDPQVRRTPTARKPDIRRPTVRRPDTRPSTGRRANPRGRRNNQ